MSRSYISSPPQAPPWRVAGLLYLFLCVFIDFWSCSYPRKNIPSNMERIEPRCWQMCMSNTLMDCWKELQYGKCMCSIIVQVCLPSYRLRFQFMNANF
jgi:hypothetical protein